jgi:hypothetical protein
MGPKIEPCGTPLYTVSKELQIVFTKKKNVLEKGNYPPGSVLPTISKFVERAIFDQLTDFFNFHFHPSLSALPCGTPLYIVSKELQIFFTFTHCFLPDK